ncbi:MAG: ATP-binding protein [Chloroflexota bacterium]
MYIEKLIAKNYRSLENLELDLNPHLNIIVGDNETGKSTILEVINLVLSGQINGRSIHYELHPFLFNTNVIEQYIKALNNGISTLPPQILLEVYLHDTDEFAKLKGTNNTQRSNQPGVYMSIEFDEEYAT